MHDRARLVAGDEQGFPRDQTVYEGNCPPEMRDQRRDKSEMALNGCQRPRCPTEWIGGFWGGQGYFCLGLVSVPCRAVNFEATRGNRNPNVCERITY